MVMFDIDNLVNSPISDAPWRHQCIEDFFQQEDFEKVKIAAIELEKIYKDKLITADNCLSLAEVYDTIGEEVFNIILEANKKLLNNIELIVKNFPNHNKFKDYISLPSFHILPPNSGWQKIHDESSDKTVSVVVYLYPENSIGTTLYEENNRNSNNKEIPWKQNSAMLFCGQQGVTWHDFCSKENPRVTLNFFLRTINDLELQSEEDRYVWTFGNGLKTFIPKRIPKEKLQLLTSGVLFRTL
jgi:hypothetical protein